MSRNGSMFERYRAPKTFSIGGTPIINEKETLKCNNKEESESDEEQQLKVIVKKKPPVKKVRKYYEHHAEKRNDIENNNMTFLRSFSKKNN